MQAWGFCKFDRLIGMSHMILEILPRDFGVELVDSGGLEILTLFRRFGEIPVKLLQTTTPLLLAYFHP